MKLIEKKSLTKTQMLAIILSSAFLVLLAVSIVLSIVLAKLNEEEPAPPPSIREDLGEALYSGSPIVYERFEEGQIAYLNVDNELGRFFFIRDVDGNFAMRYYDSDGELREYRPPVVDLADGVSYDKLYAVDEADGYGQVYMLSYLCSAVGTPYFTERIDLPEDTETRRRLLKEYGLVGEGVEPTKVELVYHTVGADGKVTDQMEAHVLWIGSPALNGDGNYFMVDGRDCIYYSKYDFFKYAELGIEAFVKGALVSEGLSEDKSFEPLLTTKFTEWVNTMHTTGGVLADSTVIGKGEVKVAIKESAELTPEKYPTGYGKQAGNDIKLELSKLKLRPDYDRIAATLVGAAISGEAELPTPILLTLIEEAYEGTDMLIDFGGADSLTYTYTVTAIEAVLDGAGGREVGTSGTPVGTSRFLRIEYNYSVGGKVQNTVPRHAVIDLNDGTVPTPAVAALSAASVGKLDTGITFDITYTKDNARTSTEKMVLTDIVSMFGPNGENKSVIDDSCYVVYKYEQTVDGKTEIKTDTKRMSDIKDNVKFGGLYTALLGKSLSRGLDIKVYDETFYHERLSSFVTYEIKKIEGCLTSREVVSFRFLNEEYRDPFFGESIYENLTGGYRLYGINADVCQSVLRILGGLNEDTSSSLGLSGETVAVGLTNENMRNYNLYDYTVYFEMPRGIISNIKTDGDEEIEEYEWRSTIGFTLYVSRPDPATGTRYVGSDMYDVIARVPAETFVFLEYDFVEFWARQNMIMLDVGNIDDFEIDFYMTDVKGSYDFDLNRQIIYLAEGGQVSTQPYDGAVEQELYTVFVTQSGDVMQDTELYKYAKRVGSNRVALHTLYNEVMGGGEKLTLPNSAEWVGVSNLMLAFQVMQLTSYEGVLSPEEQAKASDANKLMRIRLSLFEAGEDRHNPQKDKEKEEQGKNSYYVYEFYRVSDRRVMVKTYQINSLGEQQGDAVSHFYISTFSFKKMVSAYLSVFNAKSVDGNVPYPDEAAN